MLHPLEYEKFLLRAIKRALAGQAAEQRAMLAWYRDEVTSIHSNLRLTVKVAIVGEPRPTVGDVEHGALLTGRIGRSIVPKALVHQEAVASLKIGKFEGVRLGANMTAREQARSAGVRREVRQRHHQ